MFFFGEQIFFLNFYIVEYNEENNENTIIQRFAKEIIVVFKTVKEVQISEEVDTERFCPN